MKGKREVEQHPKEEQKPKHKLAKGTGYLYEKILDKIIVLIHERQLQPHDPVPSEAELASLFGVSRRTSKEALLALAREGIVYRLPRRGTFLAKPISSEVGSSGNGDPARDATESGSREVADHSTYGGRNAIAIIIPEIDDYIGQVMSAAQNASMQQGYELIFRVFGTGLEQEESVLRELAADSDVKGIILFPGDRKTCGDEVLRLHLAKYPIVIVDRTFREINIPSVYHDHYQGGYDLTSYMITKGHQKIGFVSEEVFGIMSREERYQGFIQAHLDHKLPIDTNRIYTEFPTFKMQDQDRLWDPDQERSVDQSPSVSVLDFKAFLRENPMMTAIFCSNDYVALRVMNTAQQLQIRIPEKLSLVGFTDVPLSSAFPVPLTTVRKSPGQLGTTAVQLLLKRIQSPEIPPESINLPTQLIERGSIVDRSSK